MSEQTFTREEKIALYGNLIETIPNAECRGDTIPYTSLNGHMYSYFSKDNVVALRLPDDAKKEFIKKYKTTLMVAYGIVQKEYVVVPDNVLKNTKELKFYFKKSYDYVSKLKPKPAKKKK